MAEYRVQLPSPIGDLPGVRAYDLSLPLFNGMSQSPNHPRFTHALVRRHGDMVRDDGGSAANDVIVMGTHVGTHIDALAHVSHEDRLHGGASAHEAQQGGRFEDHGIHTVGPILRRGILLDVPGFMGLEACPPGYEISSTDLAETAKSQAVTIEPGDVVLIRSGWGRNFREDQPDLYLGHETGVPGVGAGAAEWLADRKIFAAGADSIAFECVAPGNGHRVLPAHRILLVDNGIFIIESLQLEELAGERLFSFGFIALPLRFMGATGSPIRPIALAWNAHA